jgi:phosphoribosylglycinamide formyltransferase-1
VDRVINLHPSLLPDFRGGMDAIERSIASGAKMTGATVHLVTEALDAGPILIQEAVPILEGDTVESLSQRVHEAEHRILPRAIRLMEARIAPGTRGAR